MMEPRPACHECHLVNDPDKQICENHGSSSLTGDWASYVVIVHPESGEIATEMNVIEPGGYILKVR